MISVFGSDITQKEIDAVTDVLKSQWLGMGKKVEEFERAFSNMIGQDAAMVDNCSNALYMAVKLLDLPPHSRVVLPSLTWVACAQAVLVAGHVPVFCDVDYDTMNVRASDIEGLSPDAVMVVHYAGLPVDMEPILALGVPVIEDAAHAVYSTYNGKHCGTIGDIGVYSFDSTKNLVTSDGGGITCRNPDLLARAKVMRYCGIGKSGFETAASNASGRWWEYDIKEPFLRMVPNNIAAALGLVQLGRRFELTDSRRDIWNWYDKTLPAWVEKPEVNQTMFTYSVKVPKRDALANYLLENGVYTTLRFHPLHLNPIYRQSDVSLPNCERLNEELLSLPLHPRMTEKDNDEVISLIIKFGKKHGF